MSRTKEELEIRLVKTLCNRLGVDENITNINGLGTDDPPDVEVEIAEKMIGVECTAYQGTFAGQKINELYNHQALRSDFYDYVDSRNIASITGFHVERLSFLGAIGESVRLPPRKLFEAIVDEIISLIGEHSESHKTESGHLFHRAEIRRSGRTHIIEYINNISYSTKAPLFIGHSETISRVDFNDKALVRLIENKTKAIARKREIDPIKINRYNEFWLLIHNGEFEPLFSSVNRLRDYRPSVTTQDVFENSYFDRVFVCSLGRTFEIHKDRFSVELISGMTRE